MHLFFMSYQASNNIKSWAEEERPREKLILNGHRSLTDSELIAILIGSGTKNSSAVALARQVLSLADNNLSQLGRITLTNLTKIKGIGQAKAISILAALELGRRRQQTESPQQRQITSSRIAYEILAPVLSDLNHEEFWAILVNRGNKVIKYKCLSVGGMAGTIVDSRQIFRWALQEHASAVVLAHNHPSGTLQPSKEDIRITNEIVQGGSFIDIKILDHLIITNEGFYSFADNGLIA